MSPVCGIFSKKVTKEKHKNTNHGALSRLGQGTFGCSISVREDKELETEIMRQIWKEKADTKKYAIVKDQSAASYIKNKEELDKASKVSLEDNIIVIWKMKKSVSRYAQDILNVTNLIGVNFQDTEFFFFSEHALFCQKKLLPQF